MLLLKDWTTGRFALAGMVAVAALAVPIFTVSYWSTVLGAAVFYALIALSIVVLTGWTGQISLAALAFAGAGAFGSALLSTQAHLPPFVVLPLCGLIGVPLAVLIGVPALRLRGFFLALATLAFMVACESWLFTQPGLTTRNDVDRMFLRVDLSQPSYYLSLGFALLVFLGVRNLGKTKVARAFHAIRDSENTAVSMGIDPVKYKLLAFALSGFIAGIAGGSFGYMNLKVVSGSFTFFFSLTFITFAVIAGLGLQAGAFLVPILFVIVPTLTARTTTGTNQSLFILSGYLAVRATIDYPNGVAAFWSRLLRPFSPSERVAWTTDEAAGAPAPEAALASAEADEPELFAHAAEELETTHA
jgi:branched-chain amino acid transport system permease protein